MRALLEDAGVAFTGPSATAAAAAGDRLRAAEAVEAYAAAHAYAAQQQRRLSGGAVVTADGEDTGGDDEDAAGPAVVVAPKKVLDTAHLVSWLEDGRRASPSFPSSLRSIRSAACGHTRISPTHPNPSLHPLLPPRLQSPRSPSPTRSTPRSGR